LGGFRGGSSVSNSLGALGSLKNGHITKTPFVYAESSSVRGTTTTLGRSSHATKLHLPTASASRRHKPRRNPPPQTYHRGAGITPPPQPPPTAQLQTEPSTIFPRAIRAAGTGPTPAPPTVPYRRRRHPDSLIRPTARRSPDDHPPRHPDYPPHVSAGPIPSLDHTARQQRTQPRAEHSELTQPERPHPTPSPLSTNARS